MPTQKEWKELEKGFLGIFALYDKMYKAHLTAMGEKAPHPIAPNACGTRKRNAYTTTNATIGPTNKNN